MPLPIIFAAGEAIAAGGAEAAGGAVARQAASEVVIQGTAREAAATAAPRLTAQARLLGSKQAAQAASQAVAHASESPVRRVLNDIWTTDAAIRGVTDRFGKLDSMLPTFEHTIAASIQGGPDATMKLIWDQAVALAFGRYRTAVPGTGSIAIESVWDYTNKQVGIKITYVNNGKAQQFVDNIGVPRLGQSALTYIIKGPREETLGGTWADYDAVSVTALGGILVGTPAVKVGGLLKDPVTKIVFDKEPALEINPPPNVDTGRLMTTRIKTDYRIQPPQPPTFDVISLVSNLLSKPCYRPFAPPLSLYPNTFPQSVSPTDPLMAGPIPSNVDVAGPAGFNLKDSNTPVDPDIGRDSYLDNTKQSKRMAEIQNDPTLTEHITK